MHSEHDALPVVAGNGDSSIFVAATLVALVLAGSALVYRKTFEQQPEREKLTHPSEQPTPHNMDTEKNQPPDLHRDADGVSSSHDPDSKESKSSRSKDRRRRGKDPLKENLKGGKKLKGTTTMPVKQLFTGQPSLDDLDNLNNTPAPSTPASSSTRNSTPNSLSRGSGKRTQPDDSLYDLTAEAPAGTVHSRPTSEVSQSNTGSKIPDQPHPHRDRTSFTSVSDHHVSQSSSSSHNETEHNTSFLEQTNPDFLIRETPSIFSTIIPNNDFVNHSLPSSASSATTSCVITPATSPSLSHTSSKLVPHVGADSEFAPNNGSGSDCGPKNNSVSADPSHALGADTKTRKQQLPPNPTPSRSKSKTKTNAQNTWEWDNSGEVPPSSSSISASVIASAPTSSLITAPAFPPDIVYRKPPRLQPKSLWSKNAKNDAPLSSIPGSVSHPSLLSPTSGSFAPSDSALLSPSISSSLEKVPSRVSKVSKEGEGGESEEERDTADNNYTQLEFPTLNPIVTTTLASNGGSTAAAGLSNNHRPTTPRRAHSSRGPPTPSGSTPPPHLNSGAGSAQPPSTPAVSTQTQLASLRGALEAARLREEKHKADVERYTKELEALRWENMNSRRGEVELQNHIRHLMNQLQMFSSLFPSVTPQPTSQQQQTQGLMAGSTGLSNPGDRATSAPESGNGPTTSSPSMQHVQSPTAAVFPGPPVSSPRMHLHMLPPLQLNSPSSMHTPSPYFPYPMPPSLHPHSVMPSPHPLFAQQFHHMQQQFLQFQQYQQHQPQIQNQSQSPTTQAQQGNTFSMLHQSSLANISSYQSYVASSSSSMASGSRSSSRPGTESAGSSPDLNGSSPGPGSKRKVRTRTKTTNGYIGGRAVRMGAGDGWVVGGVGIDEGGEDESIHEDEERGANGYGDEDEGGFNEILADAILKRPDSIGVRSGKKNKRALLEKEMEEGTINRDRELERLEDNILDAVEPLTEFKFPSLSDMADGGHDRSSSSSSVVVSEDLGPNIFDLPALASQDIVHFGAVVSQNGVDNRNENHSTLKTTSSSSESETTPRREESEANITEPLMNGAEEATNVPRG